MSDVSLPAYLPAAEDLSRREASNLSQRLTAGVAAGAVRETPTLDVAIDRLQAVAQQNPRVSQAARDSARLVTPAASANRSPSMAQHQQLAPSGPKTVL